MKRVSYASTGLLYTIINYNYCGTKNKTVNFFCITHENVGR